MALTSGINYTLCNKCRNDLSSIVNHKVEIEKIKCSFCGHYNKSAN